MIEEEIYLLFLRVVDRLADLRLAAIFASLWFFE